MNQRLILGLATIFIATQLLGLFVGQSLVGAGVQATIVNDNPNDVWNAIGLVAYILVGTGIVLAAIVFLKPHHSYWVMKALGTSLIVFSAFLDGQIALALSIILIGFRLVYAKNIVLRNISSTLATAGVGALLGASLGVAPILLFMVLLSVYDFIAVFKTKHMVVMAKALTSKNLAFTFALPTPEHTFELGTGDLVVPLAFSVAVLKASSAAHAFPINWLASLIVLGASLVGLVFTIEYVSKRVGTAVPALPLQSAFMIIAYALVWWVGF